MENVNILLVEDDEVNRFVTVSYLRKWNINVTTANNGKEGLAMVQSKNFDLILMDINMPEMDGYEATACIREMNDPYFKTVPIIAFSASSMITTREEAKRHGMTDTICKPLRSEDLLGTINRYVLNLDRPQEIHVLNIDFDQYTDGDERFKSELILMIIENIEELRQSLKDAITFGAQNFLDTCHKITTTVSMINDREFENALSVLRNHLKSKAPIEDTSFKVKLGFVDSRCEAFVKSLQKIVYTL